VYGLCRENNAKIINCVFNGNLAVYYGGGMQCYGYGSVVTAVNCMFISNSATSNGGGVEINYSTLKLTNCTFTGNSSSKNGGGVFTAGFQTDTVLTSCIFNGNTANNDGGGICCGHSDPTLINCTFYDNSADYGGGICSTGSESKVTVNNCILWDNQAYNEGPQIALKSFEGCIMFIDYSCVKDGELDVYKRDDDVTLNWLDGNIDLDLLFTDADNDDYHLLSQAGRWDPNTSIWVIDGVTSPCIDVGDPALDWTAELWPNGKQINMDAFGGMPQASVSESPAGNIADLDANDVVNYADLKLFTEGWLRQQMLLS
jgi:parallel beta-helix repeat protein/predicted outer membrane repeat protein